MEGDEQSRKKSSLAEIHPPQSLKHMSIEKTVDFSQVDFLSDLSSIGDYYSTYYQSKIQSSVFADAFVDIPRELRFWTLCFMCEHIT